MSTPPLTREPFSSIWTKAADPIDLTDDRWEVFYLFEEETKREVLGEKWRPAALAGYFTVFGFRNPVKGVSLRICQALILPHFQRQGEGWIGLWAGLHSSHRVLMGKGVCILDRRGVIRGLLEIGVMVSLFFVCVPPAPISAGG